MLPNGGWQLVLQLVPKGFDRVPKGRAGERIEQVAADRQRDQLGGRRLNVIGVPRLGTEPPDFAAPQILTFDVKARGNERFQIALDRLQVQRSEAELFGHFVAQLFERLTDAGAFQELKQPVLADELLVAS